MQDKDDKNLPDIEIICEYIRESLENVNIPVSDRCWENISMRLARDRKRRQARWALAGIAAVFLLMITLTAIDNSRQKEISPVIYATVCNKNVKPVPISLKVQVKNENKTVVHSERPSSQSNTQSNLSETPPVQSEKASVTTEEKKSVNTESVEKNEYSKPVYSLNNDSESKVSPDKNKRWVASALLSSTGDKSGSGFNRLMSDSEGNLGSAGNQNNEGKNRYSGILSFGLKISRQLSEKISLETGLVYSCLTTTFRTPEGPALKTLRLHYIGVPINLKMSLLKISPHMELYASAGVMAEKGLQARLTEVDGRPFDDGSHTGENMSTYSKVKGLQYSISASAGISYKIHRNLSLYAEPHISHYFDNDQPMSIRTVHRTIPTVNTGLRFEF